METFFTCDCGSPASIVEEFLLDSTDGPVLHVRTHCVSGHHYLMAADRLSS